MVPVYLHVSAGVSHFRLRTEFLVKPEFWNAAKHELKPVYFDQTDFTIAQRNAVEQGLRDLKNFVEREIGLNNANSHTVSRDYSPNTIGRHIKHLKSILRAAKEEGLHSNTAFEHKDFRVTRMPVQNIYLAEDEIRRLFELPLEGFDEKVRDLLLIDEEETAERLSVHPYFNHPVEILDEKPAGQKLPIELHHLLDFSSN